jgi:hypothetical protein
MIRDIDFKNFAYSFPRRKPGDGRETPRATPEELVAHLRAA